jgi:hypothetical protein
MHKASGFWNPQKWHYPASNLVKKLFMNKDLVGFDLKTCFTAKS